MKNVFRVSVCEMVDSNNNERDVFEFLLEEIVLDEDGSFYDLVDYVDSSIISDGVELLDDDVSELSWEDDVEVFDFDTLEEGIDYLKELVDSELE